MKICVAGLGIIGGSLCMSLKRAGYSVDGCDRSEDALRFAVKNGIVDGAPSSFTDYDVVFVALPLNATLEFITRTRFGSGTVVADVCGVKKPVEDAVLSSARDIRYVGTHPMAGKEASGIQNACADLFDGASMVITRNVHTDEAACAVIKRLVSAMGFKRLVECSAEVHDKKISYTSQLAHVVSNCYVKDDAVEGCLGFTGGSFQDMTRIAGVDEKMWAELYLANSRNLSRSISLLCERLSEVNAAISVGDLLRLSELLREGRERFQSSKSHSFQGDGITVTQL